MNTFCQVRDCRFANTHLTSSHMCKTCHEFGHGHYECGNQSLISSLKNKSHGIRFPHNLYCLSPCCPSPYSHSSDAHYCSQCRDRHLESVCPSGCVISSDSREINRVKADASITFGNTDGKIYTNIYVGQGCEWYVKRNFKSGLIQVFFMHGDSWGQYGSNTDDRQKLNSFCSGYRNIKDGQMFVLPS